MIERMWLKIGDAAKAVGVSTKELRYWETVIPELEPRRSRGNLRYYHVDELPRLRQIRAWVAEGMTVADCRELLLTGKLSRDVEAVTAEEEEFQLLPSPTVIARKPARAKQTPATEPQPLLAEEEVFELQPAPEPTPKPKKPKAPTQAQSKPESPIEDEFQLLPSPILIPKVKAHRMPRPKATQASAQAPTKKPKITGLAPVKRALRALVKRLSRPPKRPKQG